jgi:methionyl-tRNA synthetase
MALDIQPPKQILAHGWWKNNGEKMSKSLGNVLDPNEIIDTFGRDYMRYFLLREMPIGQDGSFSNEGLIQRVNGELVNNIGNLVQRVTSFAYKNLGGIVKVQNDFHSDDNDLLNATYGALDKIKSFISEYKINDAIGVILDIGHRANKYIEKHTPWKLKKDNPSRMEVVIYTLLESIRVMGILLQPFVPDSSKKILSIIYSDPSDIKFSEIDKRDSFKITPVSQVLQKL